MCIPRLDVTVYWRSSANNLPVIFNVRSKDKVEAGKKVSTAVHDVAPSQTCRKRRQRTDLQASRKETNDCELPFNWLLQSWYALACLITSHFISYLSWLLIVYVSSKSYDNSDGILTLIKLVFFNKFVDYQESQYTCYATVSHHDALLFNFPQPVITAWRKRKFEDDSDTVSVIILRRKWALIWRSIGFC